jgi:SAM-dependent methyltransferase
MSTTASTHTADRQQPRIETHAIPCPVCAADAPAPHSHNIDRLYGLPQTYTLSRCTQCGTIYQNPQVLESQLSRLYPDVYEPYSAAPLSHHTLWPDLKRAVVLATQAHATGGALLDIGCGGGNFLQAVRLLRGSSWSLCGVEPSATAAQRVSALGIPVVNAGISEALSGALAGRHFDVVTLIHVIEHLPRPVKALQKIRDLLAPGGRLLIQAPVHDSFERAVFGRHWMGWDQPRHLTLFDRRTLKRACEAAGLEVTESHSFDTVGWCFRASASSALGAGPRLRQLIDSRASQFLLKPYLRFQAACQRSSACTLIARAS